jgi:hypothetical protein
MRYQDVAEEAPELWELLKVIKAAKFEWPVIGPWVKEIIDEFRKNHVEGCKELRGDPSPTSADACQGEPVPPPQCTEGRPVPPPPFISLSDWIGHLDKSLVKVEEDRLDVPDEPIMVENTDGEK